jgi:hypothetical protein
VAPGRGSTPGARGPQRLGEHDHEARGVAQRTMLHRNPGFHTCENPQGKPPAMAAGILAWLEQVSLSGEAAEDQHYLGSNSVDHVTNFLVVEHEVDELCDLNVVDGDRGLIPRCDDQVLLLGPLQF